MVVWWCGVVVVVVVWCSVVMTLWGCGGVGEWYKKDK